MTVRHRATQDQPRRSSQRDAILRGAAKAFSKLGFRATTMDDIAKEVHATRGLIYYHFRSKAEIYSQLHTATLAELMEGFHRAVGTAQGYAEQLECAIQAHVGFVYKQLTLARLTSRMIEVSPARDFPKGLRDGIIAKRDEYEKLMRDVIDAGVREGVFRPTDTSIAVKNILGALNWLAFWYRPRGRLKGDELKQLISDDILRGLLSGSRPAPTPPETPRRRGRQT